MSYLIYFPKTLNEKVYPLNLGVNSIGRGINNNIFLSSEHDSLSRYHAEIKIAEDSVLLKDLGSKNGTFVNSIRIKEKEIHDGDLIICGDVIFQFVEAIAKDEKSSEPLRHQRSLLNPNSVVMVSSPPANQEQHSILMLPHQDAYQRTVDKLQVLLEVSKQLCVPEEPEEILRKILDLLWEIMSVDRAIILMVNEASGELESEAVKLREEIAVNHNLPLYSRKITNLVLEKREPIITSNALVDKRFKQSYSILQQSIHASMCVPLKTQHGVMGVVYVDNLVMSSVYSQEDLEFLSALANQAAVAIHMSREFYKREQKLKKQVAELKIQIDQSKKQRQVEEIIGSDFFKDLQKKAEKLRLREQDNS